MSESEGIVSKVSDTANVYLSGVVVGVSDVASSVTYGVGGIVHSLKTGVGDAVHNISDTTGVGDVVHNVTSGMKRMMTLPPPIAGEEEDSPGLPPRTPGVSDLSPGVESSPCDLSPNSESEIARVEAAINNELGLKEDYFSHPEGRDSIAELEHSIELCKSLILQCEESSVRRRTLVHKLIQLRYRLQEAKEETEIASTGVRVLLGHQLQPQHPPLTRTTKQYCDKCAQIIWGVIHVSYKCSLCEYQCHGRCVEGVQRRCASVRVAEDPNYILHICPEVGLSAQNYKCAECSRLITNKNVWCEPRLCDYTGLFFCPACHWNSRQIIPGRVTHNWDFDEQLVSRSSKQILLLMKHKPVLDLHKLNPSLIKFVEELTTVKNFRVDLLKMKQYLSTCRTAQESRMLRQLQDRQHFVENSHMYSLQDLIDINNGVLVTYLKNIHQVFKNHIKKDCLICQGKGYICEICDVSEIIFPFDGGVIVCDGCGTVLHNRCFTSRSNSCPRCARQKARRRQEALPDT